MQVVCWSDRGRGPICFRRDERSSTAGSRIQLVYLDNVARPLHSVHRVELRMQLSIWRLLVLVCMITVSYASQLAPRYTVDARDPAEYQAHPAGDLVCRPFGECSPCPPDERHQPFCQPFGNRRLLHCLPSAEKHSHLPSSDTSEADGEVPAWEACGKVVAKEKADYWEFVTANILFLMLALAILAIRSSSLAAAQYRQLAAKIGIPAVGGAGWRG